LWQSINAYGRRYDPSDFIRMTHIGVKKDRLRSVAEEFGFNTLTVVPTSTDEDGPRTQAGDSAYCCLSDARCAACDQRTLPSKFISHLLRCILLQCLEMNR
jgi:hypothetical protein